MDSKTEFLYSAGNKYCVTKTPSYKCETTGEAGEVDTNKIGMITFDELIYAGVSWTSFLSNNVGEYLWWTLSPNMFNYNTYSFVDGHWVVYIDDGSLIDFNVSSASATLRPVVTLKSGITIASGNGTISNPYTVK